MNWPVLGLYLLFFGGLIGQYVYREAKREGRSSPILRGLCWGVLGVVGAGSYLVRIRELERRRVGWIGFSTLLVAIWGIGTTGLWGTNDGFYLWAGLFAGLFVLYWQFDLEADAEPSILRDGE